MKYRKQMLREKWMKWGEVVDYVCGMRYNKESGGEKVHQKIGRHEHLHVRIFQRLNFGGPLSPCPEIASFRKRVG